MTFDLIIKGGWVIDGSGGPPFRADVALLETMIAEVGRLDGAEAPRVLDADGPLRRPRLHRRPRPRRPDAPGRPDPSARPAPGRDDLHHRPGRQLVRPGLARDARLHAALHRRLQRQPAAASSYDWRTVDEYLARFDRSTAINVAYLIPNGNVRMEVMGLDPRPATDDELAAMQQLVREGMDAGAVGLSTGSGLHPQPLCRRPRDRRALRGDRRGERRLRHPHAGLRPERRRSACARSTRSPGRRGVAAHVSHYNGPADLLLPLIDRAGRWAST